MCFSFHLINFFSILFASNLKSKRLDHQKRRLRFEFFFSKLSVIEYMLGSVIAVTRNLSERIREIRRFIRRELGIHITVSVVIVTKEYDMYIPVYKKRKKFMKDQY